MFYFDNDTILWFESPQWIKRIMISENQFLIGHLSPKLFNHLGINEIYQDPRQISHLVYLLMLYRDHL